MWSGMAHNLCEARTPEPVLLLGRRHTAISHGDRVDRGGALADCGARLGCPVFLECQEESLLGIQVSAAVMT